MPYYGVTGEEATPIDPTVASYSGEQNLFLHMSSMAFPAFKSLQPSSNTSVTSSSPRSSKPAVTSTILFISTSLSFTSPSHLSTKCSTFSTSLNPQWPQILSSLFSPIHLPVSTFNSAVPPLNFAIIHLSSFIASYTHLAHYICAYQIYVYIF